MKNGNQKFCGKTVFVDLAKNVKSTLTNNTHYTHTYVHIN